MKRFFILAIFMLFLSACDKPPSSEDQAKKIVAASLIDPESAKFESIFPGANVGEFCGYVNGKNRMGGYAGASPFIINLATSSVEIGKAPIENEDFRDYYLQGELSRWDEQNKAKNELYKRCTFPDRWKKACGKVYPLEGNPKRLCYILRIDDASSQWHFNDDVKKLFK